MPLDPKRRFSGAEVFAAVGTETTRRPAELRGRSTTLNRRRSSVSGRRPTVASANSARLFTRRCETTSRFNLSDSAPSTATTTRHAESSMTVNACCVTVRPATAADAAPPVWAISVAGAATPRIPARPTAAKRCSSDFITLGARPAWHGRTPSPAGDTRPTRSPIADRG